MNKMYRIICIAVVMGILSLNGQMGFAENTDFRDVSKDHWSYEVVHQLKEIGITEGIEPGVFGLGRDITRAEFVTFLVRLMSWEQVHPKTERFEDVRAGEWFFNYVETAGIYGVFDQNDTDHYFRPDDPIKREEMAVMIVNTLGLGNIAQSKNIGKTEFTDVTNHVGEIVILKDLGIINGESPTRFSPNNTAKREEAAAVLIRMYNGSKSKLASLNGFYAINGFDQLDLMDEFSTVSFAWSNLSYDGVSETVILERMEPKGKNIPLDLAVEKGVNRKLNVYGAGSFISDILKSTSNQNSLIEEIIQLLTLEDSYEGVVIDFEEIRDLSQKQPYNEFLKALKLRLDTYDKSLTVMLHPMDYYLGYDYKYIGEIADHVILMAHDYNAKVLSESHRVSGYTYTPVAPIGNVYHALKVITDDSTGIADRSKISLQISFAVAQWGQDKEGYVVNAKPYTPTYKKLYQRLIDSGTQLAYDEKSQTPYATYYNESDGMNYTIWYEDSRSVEAKIKLAQLFGINNISLWRLGNIPNYDDEKGVAVKLDVMSVINSMK